MAKIADARKTVEQLKLEVNIERMMVSQHIMEVQSQITMENISLEIVKYVNMSYVFI